MTILASLRSGRMRLLDFFSSSRRILHLSGLGPSSGPTGLPQEEILENKISYATGKRRSAGPTQQFPVRVNFHT